MSKDDTLESDESFPEESFDPIEDVEPVDEVEGSEVESEGEEFSPEEITPPDLPPELPPALPFETSSPAPAVTTPQPLVAAEVGSTPVTAEELSGAKWYTVSFLIFSSIFSIAGLAIMIYIAAKKFVEYTK